MKTLERQRQYQLRDEEGCGAVDVATAADDRLGRSDDLVDKRTGLLSLEVQGTGTGHVVVVAHILEEALVCRRRDSKGAKDVPPRPFAGVEVRTEDDADTVVVVVEDDEGDVDDRTSSLEEDRWCAHEVEEEAHGKNCIPHRVEETVGYSFCCCCCCY